MLENKTTLSYGDWHSLLEFILFKECAIPLSFYPEHIYKSFYSLGASIGEVVNRVEGDYILLEV